MTDLDFDELDRAINSVMKEPAPESPTEKPPAEAPVAPAQPAPEPTPPKSDAATSRKAGRYMDMKPTANQAGATPTLRTHGANSLVGNTQTDTEAAPTPAASPKASLFHDVAPPKATPSPTSDSAAEAAPAPQEAPAPSQPETAVVPSDIQAQLEAALGEHHDDTPSAPEAEPAPEPVQSEPLQEVEAPETSKEEAEQPAEPETTPEPISPFIPDAKVEKRPLGAPATEKADAPAEAPVTEQGESVPVETAAEDTNQPTPTPPEFHEDLLAVEADTPEQPATPPPVAAQPEPVETPELTIATPVGAPSISQQYTEKTNTGDQSHTPIYDTNVQPLAHPTKKKSGWGGVLLIVAIVVLCAGAAAALYFSGLI